MCKRRARGERVRLGQVNKNADFRAPGAEIRILTTKIGKNDLRSGRRRAVPGDTDNRGAWFADINDDGLA